MREYENLANGIITQAAEDYARAFMGFNSKRVNSKELKKYVPENVFKECEEFFKGDFCKSLTSVDCTNFPNLIKCNELRKVVEMCDMFLNLYTYKKRQIAFQKGNKEKIFFDIPPKYMWIFQDAIEKMKNEANNEIEEIESEDK